jgi:hypothetical protein
VGLLTSSFTDNQIIAAVTCLVGLLLPYVISWPADTAGETMGAILGSVATGTLRAGQGRLRHARHCSAAALLHLSFQQRLQIAQIRLLPFHGLLGLYSVILLLFAGAALVLTRAETRIDVVFIVLNGLLGVLLLVAYLSSGVENLRTLVGERSTRYGINTVVASVIFIVILILLNAMAYRAHRRFDLSTERVFSLSPQSAQVLQG